MFWHGPLGRAFLRRNLICKGVVNMIFCAILNRNFHLFLFISHYYFAA